MTSSMQQILWRAWRAVVPFVVLAAAACSPAADDAAPRDAGASAATAVAAPTPVPQQRPGDSSPASGAVAPVPSATPPASAGKGTAPAATTPATAAAAVPAGPRRVVLHGVDLTGVGYDQGSPTAPVVLVNFSDFGCPYCARFSLETYPAIERDYVKTGKVFFKYVPFVMGMFPNGAQAARAAECAAESGRFWAMHDRLYERQREWKGTRTPYELFQDDARAVGLDAGQFDACYAKDGLHRRTRQANAAAEALGVRVTPSFLVGDRGVEGALPLERFRELLDAAVRDARR